jgi:hypothetical protein
MNTIVKQEKIESLGIFIASVVIYWVLGFNFLWFALLLFSIDISMVGYLFNNTLGAHIYNAGHNYIFPSLFVIVGIITSLDFVLLFSIIWISHISIDRALGYGLKLESGFKDTHLGKI